jgi:hypothetical protein
MHTCTRAIERRALPSQAHTGTQAHRHTGTQAHRHTGTQAHRHTGTQAQNIGHTDTQHRAHRHTLTHRHRTYAALVRTHTRVVMPHRPVSENNPEHATGCEQVQGWRRAPRRTAVKRSVTRKHVRVGASRTPTTDTTIPHQPLLYQPSTSTAPNNTRARIRTQRRPLEKWGNERQGAKVTRCRPQPTPTTATSKRRCRTRWKEAGHAFPHSSFCAAIRQGATSPSLPTTGTGRGPPFRRKRTMCFVTLYRSRSVGHKPFPVCSVRSRQGLPSAPFSWLLLD